MRFFIIALHTIIVLPLQRSHPPLRKRVLWLDDGKVSPPPPPPKGRKGIKYNTFDLLPFSTLRASSVRESRFFRGVRREKRMLRRDQSASSLNKQQPAVGGAVNAFLHSGCEYGEFCWSFVFLLPPRVSVKSIVVVVVAFSRLNSVQISIPHN